MSDVDDRQNPSSSLFIDKANANDKDSDNLNDNDNNTDHNRDRDCCCPAVPSPNKHDKVDKEVNASFLFPSLCYLLTCSIPIHSVFNN